MFATVAVKSNDTETAADEAQVEDADKESTSARI